MTVLEEKGRYRRAKGFEAGGDDLQKINRYTRREFDAEELFTFSVILCDNEIDRDRERFTPAALEKLAELFVGKTGVFDHEALGRNQTARIYDCAVKTDPARKTMAGEAYSWLEAKAYMVKNEQNAPLIAEIDAGIKKEVSVGCSVARVSCSVCGKEAAGCVHQKGKKYGGRLCHYLLEEPEDAYEWSFVAVPAQKNAGVTKRFAKGKKGREEIDMRDFEEIRKVYEHSPEELSLSGGEAGMLVKRLCRLEKEAELGAQYKRELVKEVCRLAFLADERVDGPVMKAVAEKMDVAELKAFCSAFEQRLSPEVEKPQLSGGEGRLSAVENGEFKL